MTARGRRWQNRALCVQIGSDWWFPEARMRINPCVLATCRDCPVRRTCLTFALDNDVDHGVWAGLTADEIDTLRTARDQGDETAVDEALVVAADRVRDDAAVYYAPSQLGRRQSSVVTPTNVDTVSLALVPDAAEAEPTTTGLADAEALASTLRRSA